MWQDGKPFADTERHTPPRPATTEHYRALAAAAIAAVNDAHTLLPGLVLRQSAAELGTVSLLAACTTQHLHLLPFHGDGFGVWRLFWAGVSRAQLEGLALELLEVLAAAAEAAAIDDRPALSPWAKLEGEHHAAAAGTGQGNGVTESSTGGETGVAGEHAVVSKPSEDRPSRANDDEAVGGNGDGCPPAQ